LCSISKSPENHCLHRWLVAGAALRSYGHWRLGTLGHVRAHGEPLRLGVNVVEFKIISRTTPNALAAEQLNQLNASTLPPVSDVRAHVLRSRARRLV
jgi:hypothetical protein